MRTINYDSYWPYSTFSHCHIIKHKTMSSHNIRPIIRPLIFTRHRILIFHLPLQTSHRIHSLIFETGSVLCLSCLVHTRKGRKNVVVHIYNALLIKQHRSYVKMSTLSRPGVLHHSTFQFPQEKKRVRTGMDY